MVSTWLADALQYELWVVSDGSIANDIYFSDIAWPIRKILHWKGLRDEKRDLCSRLNRSTADLGQEVVCLLLFFFLFRCYCQPNLMQVSI